MSTKSAGIGEMVVTINRNETLITYSLGSCLGVIAYDPVVRTGGILHCKLPQADIDPKKATVMPGTFVDSGVPAFFRKMSEHGANPKRMILKAAGCSNIMDERGTFNIGKRNHATFRKILWQHGLVLHGEEFFGRSPRTIALEMSTGRCLLKQDGKTIEW